MSRYFCDLDDPKLTILIAPGFYMAIFISKINVNLLARPLEARPPPFTLWANDLTTSPLMWVLTGRWLYNRMRTYLARLPIGNQRIIITWVCSAHNEIVTQVHMLLILTTAS